MNLRTESVDHKVVTEPTHTKALTRLIRVHSTYCFIQETQVIPEHREVE